MGEGWLERGKGYERTWSGGNVLNLNLGDSLKGVHILKTHRVVHLIHFVLCI